MVKKTIEKKKKTVLKESAEIGLLKQFRASEIKEKRDRCAVTLTFDGDQQLRVVFPTEEKATELQDYVFLWNKRAAITGVEFVYKPKEKPNQYTVCVLVASLRIPNVFDTKREALAFLESVEFMMDEFYHHERAFALTRYGKMYRLATDNSFSFICSKSDTNVFF